MSSTVTATLMVEIERNIDPKDKSQRYTGHVLILDNKTDITANGSTRRDVLIKLTSKIWHRLEEQKSEITAELPPRTWREPVEVTLSEEAAGRLSYG